jgi:Cysteine-rich domain
VASCPHCFNTIANEYPQLGGSYEVIHHTQLLARLVEAGQLTPVARVEEKLTYHGPCFLGRHNRVFTPPREILESVPGVQATEMHRCKERGFCCGAGGARMWMEERIGTRINTERIGEALALSPISRSARRHDAGSVRLEGAQAGPGARAWRAAPQATRASASGRPQAVRASRVCWPGAGAGVGSRPGVREKRGAGAGWIMPSAVR